MGTLNHYKPNELEMALRIAKKAINCMLEEKPNGGLVVNKGQDVEAKMSYKEAKLCIERIERKFAMLGAFSFGICGCCTKWDTRAHCTAKWDDFGECRIRKETTHRYDSCSDHSIKNGGWGL